MKKILNLLLVLFPIVAVSQTQTENYIKTTTYKVESTSSITNPTSTQANQSITYFDGLGRPVQQIAHQQSGSGKDIVTPIEYDAFGRQEKEYLPYVPTATASLNYKTTALTDVGAFYNIPKYENTGNPYSKKEFEASPLSRVLKQAAPGEDWKLGNGHEIRFDYQTNTSVDQVRLFGVSFIAGNTENPKLEDNGIYAPSQLYKTVTKDENWKASQSYPDDHTTQEFKDKEGRIVLKRTFDSGKWLDTYYVYDAYGNLTYVLPPKFDTNIIQTYLGQGGFHHPDDGYFDFFASGSSYVEFSIDVSSAGVLTFSLYADGFVPGVVLKSGKISDLKFSPDLPDMLLGNIMVRHASGNSVVGAIARIVNGDLYFEYPASGPVGVYQDQYGNTELGTTLTNTTIADLQSASASILNTVNLDDLAYQYRYDKRNRLIEKKLPGKGTATDWEEIVYNKLDQPILTRDSNLKAQNKWLFTKYDAFGRVVYTGIINSSGSRATLQTAADAATAQYVTKSTASTTIAGTAIYYSNDANVYPTSNISELHTINYYDDYTFDNDGIVLPQTSLGINIINYNNAANTQNLTKSLLTGTKVRVLDPATPYWITTVTGYDAKARAIYALKKNNYLFTTDILQSKLDFVGKTDKTLTTHTKKTSGGATIINVVAEDIFTYDHVGRLLKQTQAINGASTPEIIVNNTYDELGQLTSKKVGGKTALGLQTVDYDYNIRGWLKNINNPNNLGQDLFGFGINYNTIVNSSLPTYSQNSPLYNGNISSTSWKTNNGSSDLKQYNYTYDALNRFKNANYLENNVANSKFNESISGYDRNGNILNLVRYMQTPNNASGASVVDNLTYAYNNGNRLIKVDDIYKAETYGYEGFKDGTNTGDDYSYDANGNMTIDKNKDISAIAYNHFNLPTKVTLSTGTIDYVYDATGVKQRKIVSPGITTDYAGGFQYENNILQFFPQPEGYIEYNSGNINYIYQYKDHLGNIRLSYGDKNNDGIIAPGAPYIYQTVWEDGFESGTGWDGTGASWGHPLDAFDTTVKHSGNRSGRIDVHNEDPFRSRAVHSTEWIAINNSVDTQYRVSGWFLIQNIPQYSRGRLELMMKKAGETEYMTLYEYKPVTIKGQWIYMEMIVTVPANIKTLNSRIAFDYNGNPSPTTGSAWYDDLKIEKVTINTQNEIIAENNYYPFGLKHKDSNNVVNSTNAGQKYKYQGQERQDELSLNWDSFKWRNYDYAIGRFMSIDPLAEKYSYNSTYAFQENKLGLGVELEGLELVYREGTSPEFKKKFSETVKFMNKKGTSGMLYQLNKQSKTTLVDNTGEGSYYNPKTDELFWDPTMAVETKKGIILSPATVLGHEIDHGLDDKLNEEKHREDSKKGSDSQYDTKEERRVITGSEQETAVKHGDMKPGEVTRTDHDGTPHDAPSPTSNKNTTERPQQLKLEEIIIGG